MDFSISDMGAFDFGPFRLDPRRRQLTRGEMAVKLPAKQFDALLYFVENAGRVVEKDELLAAVWPGRIVEESSLTQAIFLLRRALQEDEAQRYIVTAPGRGYRFVAPIVRAAAYSGAAASLGAAPGSSQTQGGPASRTPTGPSLPPAYRALPRSVAIGTVAGLAFVTVSSLVFRPVPAPERQAVFSPPPHSIAVMAFTNMSGDPGRAYLSDGLAEELINTLSGINALQVAARMSAFTFKDGKATVGEIGRKLNVGAVLEGSVRSNGSRLRVTAQLIDAVTGYQFWSHAYDRDAGDVLQLETDIAEAVAQSLKDRLLGKDTAGLTLGDTANSDAYDAYLHGMALLRDNRSVADQLALAAFEKAIAIDPMFARARVGRVKALSGIAQQEANHDQDKAAWVMVEEEKEASRAIVLAPALASTHLVRGQALLDMFRFVEADKEISLANELSPGDATTALAYSEMQLIDGHVRLAVASAEKSSEAGSSNTLDVFFPWLSPLVCWSLR